MRIVTPSHERILALQQRAGSYYYSAAANVVFRKHGVALGDRPPLIVTREAEWQEVFETEAALFEGCISDSIATRIGVTGHRSRARRLDLFDTYGEELGTLVYQRPTVRWIPSRRGDQSDPYVFLSEDPLWNASDFEFQIFAPGSATPVLIGEDDKGVAHVIGIRSGRSVVLGVPLLDVLVQNHTAPPYNVGYYAMIEHSHLKRAERWLLAILSEMGAEIEAPLWPEGFRSALTIRHDYDRPLSDLDLRALLEFYERRGLRSTWFWRLCHADRGQADAVVGGGHEVALHTEARSEGAFQQEVDTFARDLGMSPAGYAAHGGIPAPGNLGLRHIEWAIAAGMRYGETLGTANVLPHEAVVIRDGRPAASPLVIPAEHRGLDLSLAPDGHSFDTLLPEATEALALGEHCVLMNHPDVHIDVLKRLLDELDLDGVWLATMVNVADWFVGSKLEARSVSA